MSKNKLELITLLLLPMSVFGLQNPITHEPLCETIERYGIAIQGCHDGNGTSTTTVDEIDSGKDAQVPKQKPETAVRMPPVLPASNSRHSNLHLEYDDPHFPVPPKPQQHPVTNKHMESALNPPSRPDLDKDGVIFPLDHCQQPGTGSLDPQGCHPYYYYTVAKVYFDFDKDKLTAASIHRLKSILPAILENKNIQRLIIRGHADWIGSFNYNDRLSDRRIRAVRTFLQDQGIPDHWFHDLGHGEHAPIDENWQRLGRRRNRHVEIIAIETSGH